MKACKDCGFIVKVDNKCPACGSNELSEKFQGIVIIFDAEKSEVARAEDDRAVRSRRRQDEG